MKSKITTALIVTVAVLFAVSESTDFSIMGRIVLALIFAGAAVIISKIICPLLFPRENMRKLADIRRSQREELRVKMLVRMQHPSGVDNVLKEFNRIFTLYPDLKLSRWVVFRAWYKDTIDHMTKFPEIYHLTMKSDGSPYRKEDDPLYDENAPDWELFDRDHTHDFDDDDNDSNDSSGGNDMKKAAQEGFLMGVGFGATNSIPGGGH